VKKTAVNNFKDQGSFFPGDGGYFVTSSEDEDASVVVWSTESMQLIGKMKGVHEGFQYASFLPC